MDSDVCCAAACDSPDNASLLTACATRTETESEPEFTITSDFGPIAGLPFQPKCEATVTVDISFALSTGEVACIIDSVNTYSTEFGDDEYVTLEDCCAAAVAFNPDTIPDN